MKSKEELENTKLNLPKDYLSFLEVQESDELENELNYINLWFENDLVQFNYEYMVHKFAPELFFIALAVVV